MKIISRKTLSLFLALVHVINIKLQFTRPSQLRVDQNNSNESLDYISSLF